MLTKIINFVKEKEDKTFLIISIILMSSLAFLIVSIYNKTEKKEPLIFVQEKTN